MPFFINNIYSLFRILSEPEALYIHLLFRILSEPEALYIHLLFRILSEPEALYIHLLFALLDPNIGVIESNFAATVYTGKIVIFGTKVVY